MFGKLQTGIKLDDGTIIEWGTNISELSNYFIYNGKCIDFGNITLTNTLSLKVLSNTKDRKILTEVYGSINSINNVRELFELAKSIIGEPLPGYYIGDCGVSAIWLNNQFEFEIKTWDYRGGPSFEWKIKKKSS